MKRIWLIYDKNQYNNNKAFVKMFKEESVILGYSLELVFVEDIRFGNDNTGLYLKIHNKAVTLPEYAIIRTIYPFLSKHLELMGVKVYNNSYISDICNNKSATLQLMASNGIECVESTFAKNEYVSDIVNSVNECAFDKYIVKTVDGHGGKQIYLYNNHIDFDNLKDNIGSKDVVMQPFVKGEGKDLRVYVLGDKIITSILRSANGDFRANYTLGGSAKVYVMDSYLVNNVKKIIDILYKTDYNHKGNCKGAALIGIDFIIDDDNNFLLSEIEDVVGCRMIYSFTDINIVNEYLQYL